MQGSNVAHRIGYASGVYYDELAPAAGTARTAVAGSAPPVVVMIHGGGHTGACWLATADGRPGWAHRFAQSGWRVLTPDWPGPGRSQAIDPDTLTGEQVCAGLAALVREVGPAVLVTHSMGGALGWRVAELAGNVVAIAGIAPGPPGNIQPEGEIVSETETELLVRTPQRTGRMRRAGFTLMDQEFVERKLVGASKRFPREHIGAYAAMLTATASRLLYERQNTRGSQVRVQNPACFAGKPILVVTGSDDLDHPREVDGAVADWLRENGAKVEFTWLADRGIAGNGHMLMMEDNSNEIADIVIGWLDKSV